MENTSYDVPIIPWDSIVLFLYNFFSSGGGAVSKEEALRSFYYFYETFAFASTFVSTLLLMGIGYSLFRLYQIRTMENREMYRAMHDYYHRQEGDRGDESPGFHKWQQVQSHAESANSHEWRLAILEADIMLDELVFDRFGDLGDTLGERLKRIARGDFQTIDKAWEAHRIRNTIAHEGSSFQLSERDLRHVLKLYEDVFNEFQYI